MYSVIYENLCSGKYKIKSKHTEIHHIIPKYLGGLDEKDNLVELDIRQHKIAHWLLWKIYGNFQDKLVWYMRSGRYEEGIELRKLLHKEYFNKMANILDNDIQTKYNEIRDSLAEPIKSNAVNYRLLSKKEIKEYCVQHDNPKTGLKGRVPVYMFNKEGEYIQSFQSVYAANEALNYSSVGNIHSAASGNRNYAAGFRWSFNEIVNQLIQSKPRIYKKTGTQKNPSKHIVKNYRQIIQCDLNGNEIHVWNNREEIQSNLGISSQMINHIVNGRFKRNDSKEGEYAGFIWKKGKQISIIVYN
jgi:5-methylcytosine-specific restriction endonuclease McrA